MKVQFYLKPLYVVLLIGVLLGTFYYHNYRPLKYEFSSVYNVEENHHNVQIKTGTDNETYNQRCADEVAENLEKAKITNYDIRTLNDGNYQLYYKNGERLE